MRSYAADDSATIRRNIIRNRVIAMATSAGLAVGTRIPKEMFLAAGWTEEEYNSLSALATQLPILETDLR